VLNILCVVICDVISYYAYVSCDLGTIHVYDKVIIENLYLHLTHVLGVKFVACLGELMP